MNIEVKLFAGAKQAAGQSSVVVELPEGATIAELRCALAERFPAFAPLAPRAAFAINLDYAVDQTRIPVGAEVACIPPVSGG